MHFALLTSDYVFYHYNRKKTNKIHSNIAALMTKFFAVSAKFGPGAHTHTHKTHLGPHAAQCTASETTLSKESSSQNHR
jgi:hypothetical protein